MPEILEGYQQTEIGVIPLQWEVNTLESISDKVMVGIASAATHAYSKQGIILFRNQNIKYGYLDDKDILYIREEYEENFKNKRLKADDLIIARTGYPGATCVIPDKYEGTQSFTTLIVRPKKQNVRSDFLCYFLNSEVGQSFFESNQIGGGQKNVNAGSLKFMLIPLPPLPEQEAIAQPLSDVDTAIAELDHLITKKRNIKQGVTQQLLTGKKRLPGFNGKWKAREFCDFAYLSKERLDPQRVEKSYRCIELEHIEQGTSRLLGFCDSINQLSQKVVFKKGDVLFGKLRPYLKKFYLSEFNGICSTEIWAIRAKENILPEFMFLIVQTDIFLDEANNKATGTKMPRANWQDIAHLEFLLPPPTEQKAIAQVLTDMDAEIEALEQKRDKYKAIKQGMMQELLTGRTRLI
jgi:type I restriction enzyme S subunit